MQSPLKRFIGKWWPVLIVMAAFCVLYVVLIVFLSRALAAQAEIGFTGTEHGMGPSTLFVFASAILGWVIVLAIEYAQGTTAMSQSLLGACLIAVTIIAALALTAAAGRAPDGMALHVVAVCVISGGVAGACRVAYVEYLAT